MSSSLPKTQVVKANQARPMIQISTARERFHQTIAPFLLPIHIRTKDSEPYVVEKRFIPTVPNHDPVYVYSWLDDPLSQVIASVFDCKDGQDKIPKDWTKLTISSIYISNDECKLEPYLVVTSDDYKNNQPSLFDYQFEIGDHFDFTFE